MGSKEREQRHEAARLCARQLRIAGLISEDPEDAKQAAGIIYVALTAAWMAGEKSRAHPQSSPGGGR